MDIIPPVPDVLRAILAVAADIGALGISKDRRNVQQNYAFRGIDEMYNALNPLYTRHGLIVLPRMVAHKSVERATKSGGSLNYVTVEAEFDFLSAKDGTVRVVRTFGEAMDAGDKATNKAMSAAYKYAVMQAFAIPTEGDNDADATTHELAPSHAAPLPPPPTRAPVRPPPPHPPKVPVEVEDAIVRWADDAIAAFNAGDEVAAYEQVAHIVAPAEQAFLASYLVNHPGLRAVIKHYAAADAAKASSTTTTNNHQGASA